MCEYQLHSNKVCNCEAKLTGDTEQLCSCCQKQVPLQMMLLRTGGLIS